jgi:hypothetical protein
MRLGSLLCLGLTLLRRDSDILKQGPRKAIPVWFLVMFSADGYTIQALSSVLFSLSHNLTSFHVLVIYEAEGRHSLLACRHDKQPLGQLMVSINGLLDPLSACGIRH